MNKKGFTLMELLISIILVSIVLIFLMELLSDLKNETDNNDFAYNNQINRVELIKAIEQDLENNTLLGIEDQSDVNNIKIIFYYKTSNGMDNALLESYTKNSDSEEEELKYYFRYTNFQDVSTVWEMKEAQIDPCYNFFYYKDLDTSNYYFKLNINLYNNTYNELNNKENNNPIDDIEISYVGNKRYLLSNSNYLTKDENSNKNINRCTN